jgi:hypothetical protein
MNYIKNKNQLPIAAYFETDPILNNIRIVFLIINFPWFTRTQLYEIYKSVSTENISTILLNYVNSDQIWSSIKSLGVHHYLKLLKNRIHTFISEFRKPWQKCF